MIAHAYFHTSFGKPSKMLHNVEIYFSQFFTILDLKAVEGELPQNKGNSLIAALRVYNAPIGIRSTIITTPIQKLHKPAP
jgi:hypothetical protein